MKALRIVAAALAVAGGPAMASTGTTAVAATATFAGGCFWCIEEAFRQTPGVLKAVSGYTGGEKANPTYKEVCSGRTGHAEAVQVTYDPAKVDYGTLLDLFWRVHDPTQLNRQGNDVGTQYRSAIFTHDEAQKKAAEASKAALDASGALGKPVVTVIEPAKVFYPAEAYHQEYYTNNKAQPYCEYVIRPKLKKLGLKH
ncbi:MAG: peptide-methionine (S)-S-oxide reductase MsrA [Lentisphaerae bacterium]|nr:peptide-methionine (S)-S-oxide reductase MsrA [Lentisphaerota bacterium]